MNLSLCLTNDWELFGDGSGDINEVQLNPSNDLLNVLKKYNANITLMAEVMQQFAFRDHPEFQSQANEWENCVKKFVEAGNDIQLHIHPQWINANYENEWNLNNKNWSIGRLEKSESFNLLKKGKNYLEDLLKEINSDYSCKIFRAGAYYIEPSVDIVSSLKELGFSSDSSVTKGRFVEGEYDYRSAPSNMIPWNINDSVLDSTHNYTSLIEFPIYSLEMYRSEVLEKFFPKFAYNSFFGVNINQSELNWMKERDRVKSKRYPVERRLYKKKQKKNINWYIKKLLSQNHLQLDYDYIPASVFVKIIENIAKGTENISLLNELSLPVVASGHIKDAHTNENLEMILKGLTKIDMNIEYKTMSQIAKEWHEYHKNKS